MGRQPVLLLEAGRAEARDRAGQALLDAALLPAYLARRDWAALGPVSDRLLEAFPASRVAARARAAALAGTGRWSGLLAHADQLLAQVPGDSGSLAIKLKALGRLERYQEREDLLQASIAAGRASAADFSSPAWNQLARGQVTDRTLESARKGLPRPDAGLGPARHVLACVLAERGETGEALELFAQELSAREDSGLGSGDWYLLGRIAEQLGETGEALRLYGRVTPPGEAGDEQESWQPLAARRLKVLAPDSRASGSGA